MNINKVQCSNTSSFKLVIYNQQVDKSSKQTLFKTLFNHPFLKNDLNFEF